MDVYGVVSLLQMRMMNKSNESMGYWICNHIYITRCVHVSNDVQINVRVWEQKNACICCRCQWLMSPTNCCVQTRAWFTQKWCIINAIALVWCAYIGFFYSLIRFRCLVYRLKHRTFHSDVNFSLYFFAVSFVSSSIDSWVSKIVA